MEIINTPPPNYAEILKHFPNADLKGGTLFTYGDTCYCKYISDDTLVHEETHSRQQTNPEEWWNKYFIDVDFRLLQELEAYQNQWVWIYNNVRDRNERARMLHKICCDLSGDLYNNMIEYNEAVKLIKNGNNRNQKILR